MMIMIMMVMDMRKRAGGAVIASNFVIAMIFLREKSNGCFGAARK